MASAVTACMACMKVEPGLVVAKHTKDFSTQNEWIEILFYDEQRFIGVFGSATVLIITFEEWKKLS